MEMKAKEVSRKMLTKHLPTVCTKLQRERELSKSEEKMDGTRISSLFLSLTNKFMDL